MKKILVVILALGLAFTSCCNRPAERWSEEKANEWMDAQGWIVGCNYVPSTAINQIEMWQAETFDPETIDRELALAESLGFNTVRVFLSHLVYFDDPKGYIQRFDQFLGICEKHGIRALPTFWTNGGWIVNPKLGPQPETQKGVHNPAWVPTPGFEYVNNPSKWPALKKMVKGFVKAFGKDDRVLMWCIYNEPQWHRLGVKSSVPLMRASFKWARECRPKQPLTAPLIRNIVGKDNPFLPEDTFVVENSDVLSIHCYNDAEYLDKMIQNLLYYGRPIVCTEYMRRPISTFRECLPVFKKYNVGAISFGLTVGKCNFQFPWNEKVNEVPIPWEYDEPEVWFHDIFYADGTPYDEEEVEFIRQMTKK